MSQSIIRVRILGDGAGHIDEYLPVVGRIIKKWNKGGCKAGRIRMMDFGMDRERESCRILNKIPGFSRGWQTEPDDYPGQAREDY